MHPPSLRLAGAALAAAALSLLASAPSAAQTKTTSTRPAAPQVQMQDNWGQPMSPAEADCRKACRTGSGSMVTCYNNCRDYELKYRKQKAEEATPSKPKAKPPPVPLPLAAGACTEYCLRCYKDGGRELPSCESQCKGAMGHYGRASQAGKISAAAKSSLNASAKKCGWSDFMTEVRKSLGEKAVPAAAAAAAPAPTHQGALLLEAGSCEKHCLHCYKTPQHREMPACKEECKAAAGHYARAAPTAKLKGFAETNIKNAIDQCVWDMVDDELKKAGH
jgi:hypothetical protein